MPGPPGAEVVFAGPTLARAHALGFAVDLAGFAILPPVTRGDVQRLLDGPPGLAVIVDGYFHLHKLAVGHAEIRDALAAGWRVWGLSSMGAIRAAEMHALGMRGFGRVFQRYVDDPGFRDDEVALLHEPEPPYRAFSEPLVQVRDWLDAMVAAGDLAEDRRQALIAELSAMWFGDRTAATIGARIGPELAARWIPRLREFQTKAQDLAAFASARPWRDA